MLNYLWIFWNCAKKIASKVFRWGQWFAWYDGKSKFVGRKCWPSDSLSFWRKKLCRRRNPLIWLSAISCWWWWWWCFFFPWFFFFFFLSKCRAVINIPTFRNFTSQRYKSRVPTGLGKSERSWSFVVQFFEVSQNLELTRFHDTPWKSTGKLFVSFPQWPTRCFTHNQHVVAHCVKFCTWHTTSECEIDFAVPPARKVKGVTQKLSFVKKWLTLRASLTC